jgi:HSP20 family protein
MLLRPDPLQLFDRPSREVFSQPLGITTRWMPMDAVRRDGRIELALDLSGIDPATVDLTVERNLLTVKAERRWEPAEGDQVLMRERPRAASPASRRSRRRSTWTRWRPATTTGYCW